MPILLAAFDVVTYTVRYDDAGTLANFTSEERASLVTADDGVVYTIDIFVDKEMRAPVYVTYELGTFYQNYRRYVRSYDADQMHDGTPFPGLSNCEPFLYETASGLDIPRNVRMGNSPPKHKNVKTPLTQVRAHRLTRLRPPPPRPAVPACARAAPLPPPSAPAACPSLRSPPC